MRTKWITLVVIGALVAPAAARAQVSVCADRPCNVVFDWGNGSTPPDVDRRYGAPSELETSFLSGLTGAGFKFSPGGTGSVMTITVRLTPQNRALCDTMPGVNPDYSCHTVQRAAIVFTPNDSTQKSISRLDVQPRCSDPKSYPTFTQFGRFAAEMLIYSVLNEGKGSRPAVKCQ